MSSTSSPASRPLEGAVTPREELCSTGHPSNYSRRCRKRRGCRCRKRGVPPSVADKQPRQRCATAPRPRRAAEPCPRATPGHRHPEQHCHHPWCPQRSQACLCVDLTQSSHGPGIICAPSPEPPSPARAHPLQDGVLLPFREPGEHQGWHAASIKGC